MGAQGDRRFRRIGQWRVRQMDGKMFDKAHLRLAERLLGVT